MFETFFFVLAVCDGVAMGIITASLIMLVFGDKPAARIAKVMLGITAGSGYYVWCLSILVSDGSEVSSTFGLVVLFAPVVVFFVLKLLMYAFKKK